MWSFLHNENMNAKEVKRKNYKLSAGFSLRNKNYCYFEIQTRLNN